MQNNNQDNTTDKNIVNHEVSEYVMADGNIDCQKFIDDNIVVDGKPAHRDSGISVKLTIKNNSDFFINGMPYDIVITSKYNAEVLSSDLFLFLRPHEEISYYFCESTKEDYGIISKPIGYKNVISKQENTNIAYANDLTMKIDSQNDTDKGIFNVTFTNKLSRDIIETKPYPSMIFYCDSVYSDISPDNIIPVYNQNETVKNLPQDNELLFAPGESPYTINIYPGNTSIVFEFYGKPTTEYFEEIKDYSEYDSLRNNFYNAIY